MAQYLNIVYSFINKVKNSSLNSKDTYIKTKIKRNLVQNTKFTDLT